MVLQKFPQVFNDQLRCTGVTVFTQTLVDTENVNKFVSEVVFRAVSTVLCDGGSNGNWWDR